MAITSLFSKKKEEPYRKKGGSHDDYASNHPSVHHDESNWLVSYADLMTLLCGFFIILFSLSKVDEPKYEQVKESIVQQFGGQYVSPTTELGKFTTSVIDQAGLKDQTTVKSDSQGVTVSFSSSILFESMSAEVLPAGRDAMQKLAESVQKFEKDRNTEYKLVVEGHTDSKPIVGGSFATNWELSGARASTVVRLFLDKGFKPEQMVSMGYADTRPEVPSRTPAGEYIEDNLKKNRRVVIRILQAKVDSIPFSGMDSRQNLPIDQTPVNTQTQ